MLCRSSFYIFFLLLLNCCQESDQFNLGAPSSNTSQQTRIVRYGGFGSYYDDGRLGNQIADLLFLSGYCKLFNLECYAQKFWLGETFFEHNPYIKDYSEYSGPLPSDQEIEDLKKNAVPFSIQDLMIEYMSAVESESIRAIHPPLLPRISEQSQLVFGHFFAPGWLYDNYFSQNLIKEIFQVKPKIHQLLINSIKKISDLSDYTLKIAIHYRGGDLFEVQYKWAEFFYIVPINKYEDPIRWLLKEYPHHNIEIFVASDSPKIPLNFLSQRFQSESRVKILSTNNLDPKDIEMMRLELNTSPHVFIDFWILVHWADFSVTSSSSFSFTAAMLNTLFHPANTFANSKIFFRFDPIQELFQEFRPFKDFLMNQNSLKKIFTNLEQEKHTAGIQ